MIIMGLDFETTGKDPEKDRVVEVGMALWDSAFHRPVRQNGFFVKNHPDVPPDKWQEAQKAHGIDQTLPGIWGVDQGEAIRGINRWADQAEAVVAHNGTDFDKVLYESWCDRETLPRYPRIWIDTRLDVKEPLVGTLTCIAAQHGFLNPFPHQALSDVLTMLRILDEQGIEYAVERAKTPNVTVQAVVPFDRKDEAKARGYHWEPKPKRWVKRIKACDAAKEAAEAPFQIKEVRP